MASERILLIGGTSDAVRVARCLLEEGHWVLHSRFTREIPLSMPEHSRLEERYGPLDTEGFIALMATCAIQRVVDAAHPYAEQVHRAVRAAAEQLGIPYERVERERVDWEKYPDIHLVRTHREAAVLCVRLGGIALLTVGSRHIALYQKYLKDQLYARVLDCPASIDACLSCGVSFDRILRGRGPFSLEENLRHLRHCRARILVTKDSGEQGGIYEKIEAARIASCHLVVVQKPV